LKRIHNHFGCNERRMLTPGKAAIIYHSGAGRGRATELVKPTAQRLAAAGWHIIESVKTRYAGHARDKLAPSLAEQVDLIIIIAGDGTLREVCTGLCRVSSHIPIGFVPTGNANVVAREQRIPLQPGRAINLLTVGKVRQLDVGMLRTHPDAVDSVLFLAMVEIGFGARVVQITHQLRSGRLHAIYRRWGDTVYAVAALGALASPTEQRFQVYQDNAAYPRQATAAIIANTRCYAKGWSIAPDARMDDGQLDMVTRRRSGIGVLFHTYFAAAQKRRPPPSFSDYYQGKQFCFQSDIPMTIQMDGDPLPAATWMEVGVAPGRLRLITPR
jgi:diacylglycerol kinase (ATP)